MRSWPLLAGLQVVLIVTTCQCRREYADTSKACPKGMKAANRWETAELAGFDVRGVDPERSPSFTFANSEYATMVDPLIALRWSIDKDGLLHVKADYGNARIAYTLRKVCEGEGRFIAATDTIAESKGKVVNQRKGDFLEFAKSPLPLAGSVRAPSNKPLQQSGPPR